MKIYYIANARIPTEKAHGIQIAKMCEAFVELGLDLTLVVPRRKTESTSLKEYYNLRVPVPVVYLPAIDWYTSGRIGYLLSSLFFMCSYLFFLWRKKKSGERFILYTVDLDNYSSSALTLLNLPLFSEMHGAKPNTFFQRVLFRRMNGVIAINKIIVKELQEKFPLSTTSYIVEPNGVDVAVFTELDKSKARQQLGLPLDKSIVLYTGRFFEWKGLEILPQVAAITTSVRWQIVGGESEHFSNLTGLSLPPNLFFAGSRPHSEMSLWFAAADVLIVLGTARDIQSYRYTSPMKLFEYLAAGRLIVASNTPAIREIVSEEEVFFYEPDNVRDLARVISFVVTHYGEFSSKIDAAKRHALSCSWSERAQRILRFIDKNKHVDK